MCTINHIESIINNCRCKYVQTALYLQDSLTHYVNRVSGGVAYFSRVTYVRMYVCICMYVHIHNYDYAYVDFTGL